MQSALDSCCCALRLQCLVIQSNQKNTFCWSLLAFLDFLVFGLLLVVLLVLLVKLAPALLDVLHEGGVCFRLIAHCCHFGLQWAWQPLRWMKMMAAAIAGISGAWSATLAAAAATSSAAPTLCLPVALVCGTFAALARIAALEAFAAIEPFTLLASSCSSSVISTSSSWFSSMPVSKDRLQTAAESARHSF